MNKYLIISVVSISFGFTSPSLANESALCTETVSVKVNGLVCDFCARALEKVFLQKDSVENISVDLDNALVTVQMKDGQTMEKAELAKLINDSGYNVESVTKGC